MRYLLPVLLFIHIACQQVQEAKPLDATATPAFRLCQTTLLLPGLSLQAQLDTVAADRLELSLQISNNTTETLRLAPLETLLLTNDQRRHLPLSVNTETERLANGESKRYIWQFSPINDLYLYQKSGLSGPWQQQYHLPLTFIRGLADTLSFCFPDEGYKQYSNSRAGARPLLYKPAAASLSAESVARQETYWKHTFAENADAAAGSANFSEREFFTAGVNVRHALYHRGDSLYLRLQLVNHALGELQLIPKAITITAAAKHYQPLRIQGLPRTGQGAYVLKKGQRMSILLAYPVPVADSLRLSLSGLQALQTPIFTDSFSFMRQ